MRRTPFRPGNEISQTYNSGVLRVYGVVDRAQPGYAPAPEPIKKADLRFEERQLGLTRYYAARQDNVEVRRVVRTPYLSCVSPGDVVETFDGGDTRRYQVDLVQRVKDVFPDSMDLTLAKMDPIYDAVFAEAKPK